MSNYKDGDIYINRDEFLKILSVAVHEDGYVCLHINTIEGALNSVRSLQIADDSKAIPHGKWIKHIDNLFPAESTEECSVCHEEQRITGNDDNFCPHCGADMRKEGD